jgi:endonuclease/exonuclease/phosphatase (EEP) superfamily protein YafD
VTASVLRFLLLLVALLGFAAAALPALPVDTWWVRFLDYPRTAVPARLPALLPFAALAAFFRPGSRGRLAGAAALVLLGAGLAIQAVVLAPFLLPAMLGWPEPTVPAGSCPAGNRLRLLEVNVQMTNERDGRLLDMVREVDPDVAWFQETDARWEEELAPLAVTMPFSVTQTLPNYFGVHLFSKLELRDAQVHNLTASRDPSVFASVVLPTGGAVRLYAVHPRPPQLWQGTAERDAQLMAASLAMRGDAEPHVLLGDLNAVPWEGMVRRVLLLGNLADPRTGRGFLATWNAHDTL